MERPHLTHSTELGRVSISTEAIAQIVWHTAAECYGVVGMSGRGPVSRLLSRDKPTQGVGVTVGEEGLSIDVHVVVEHGLNLAEVASTIRTRVAYEVERLTGGDVAAVEVHIADVRQSA